MVLGMGKVLILGQMVIKKVLMMNLEATDSSFMRRVVNAIFLGLIQLLVTSFLLLSLSKMY